MPLGTSESLPLHLGAPLGGDSQLSVNLSVLMAVPGSFLERLLGAYVYCLSHGCRAGQSDMNIYLNPRGIITGDCCVHTVEAKIASFQQRKDLKIP